MNWNGKPYHSLDFETEIPLRPEGLQDRSGRPHDLPKPGRNAGNARLYLLQ